MNDSTRKKDNNNWLWFLVLIILAAAGYWGWQHYKKVPEKEEKVFERSVSAVPPVEREVTVDKAYIGYVTPVNDVDVRPYISGFVDEIKVTGGSEVKNGDVLLIINQAEYKAQLDAAKASVAQAQATFDNSEVYYQRIQKAGARAVSKTEIDNAKASYLSAQASLEQAKAALAEAEVNYNYTIVKATIDGIVGNVALSKGDYVSPQSVLLSIIQYNPIRVVFSITDKDYLYEAVRPEMFGGEKIRLKLADGKIYQQVGEFRYADNQINRATNSIAVYVDFANPDKMLVANAYVDVLLEKTYRGIVVRKDLVYLEPDGSYVYITDGDVVRKARAEILSEYGNNNYVLKNTFNPGENIVLDKISAQEDGRKFKIIMKSAAAAEEKN